MTTKMILSGVLLVFVFISGIFISKLGKPYHVALFTIHKLISLATIVFATMALINFNKEIGINPLQLSLAIFIAVVFILTIATGGILSAKEETAKIVLIGHKILSVLFLVGLTSLFILLYQAIK